MSRKMFQLVAQRQLYSFCMSILMILVHKVHVHTVCITMFCYILHTSYAKKLSKHILIFVKCTKFF